MKRNQDFYAKKAQSSGYPARSVYKLEEIQKKYNVINKGFRVLDIGAAPGSWSLYTMQILGHSGFLVSVDLTPLKISIKQDNFLFLQGDIFSEEIMKKLAELGSFDLILSDAAPNTTGDRLVDTERSFNLVTHIAETSIKLLKQNGKIVFKLFQGGSENVLIQKLKESFNTFKIFKPQATRKSSFETYLIGMGKK